MTYITLILDDFTLIFSDIGPILPKNNEKIDEFSNLKIDFSIVNALLRPFSDKTNTNGQAI